MFPTIMHQFSGRGGRVAPRWAAWPWVEWVGNELLVPLPAPPCRTISDPTVKNHPSLSAASQSQAKNNHEERCAGF